MVKPAELAGREDFQAGPLSVSPSRRRIEGPAGSIQVEPLTMQMFLLLLDADGKVVTRDELFEAAWGSAIVGDDSLNRAINRVRKIAAETGPGLFEIETIPRTGYRLTGALFESGEIGPEGLAEQTGPAVSRRAMLGSAAAVGIAAAGGVSLWSIRRSEADQRFNQLVRRGERALLFDDDVHGLRDLRAAVEMRPDDAHAQGLLAYTHLGTSGGSEKPGGSAAADQRARIALKLNRNEPYARLTETLLQRSALDVSATEDRLRAILASDPSNISVMRPLWSLYQSMGLSRRAWELIDHAFSLEPLTPATNYPRAQLLWIFGRNAEADRVIDRAIGLWPSHRFVRFARFMIYAYTDRPRAARAMLDSEQSRPQTFTPESVKLWQVSLDALQQRSPASVAAARRANVDAAMQNTSLSSQAVLTLAALGDVDAAFDVANSLFVFRDAVARRPKVAPVQSEVRSTAWRFAPWLFTPPAAPLRADPRFDALCQGIGLTDFWAKRGVKPDYQLGIY